MFTMTPLTTPEHNIPLIPYQRTIFPFPAMSGRNPQWHAVSTANEPHPGGPGQRQDKQAVQHAHRQCSNEAKYIKR